MARAFKSTPKGFVADLERAERRLLRTLFQDVIQLLDDDRPPTPATPVADRPDATPGADQDAFWDIVAGLGPLQDAGQAGAADGVGPGAGPVPTAAPYRPTPADPALARLLPDGVVGDDGVAGDGAQGGGEDDGTADRAAGEFRALTEDAVRRAKTQDLQRAVAALQANPVVLTEPEAVSFSRALNDVRLVLSSRLGIETEEDAEKVHEVDDWSAATDVESYMALLYNFTTWLLETLMVALSTRLPD